MRVYRGVGRGCNTPNGLSDESDPSNYIALQQETVC